MMMMVVTQQRQKHISGKSQETTGNLTGSIEQRGRTSKLNEIEGETDDGNQEYVRTRRKADKARDEHDMHEKHRRTATQARGEPAFLREGRVKRLNS